MAIGDRVRGIVGEGQLIEAVRESISVGDILGEALGDVAGKTINRVVKRLVSDRFGGGE